MIRLSITDQISDQLYKFKCDTTTFSRSNFHSFYHDEESENAPSKEELDKSHQSPQPIALSYDGDDMTFNAKTSTFTLDGKTLDLPTLLNTIFYDHSNSTRIFSRKRMKFRIALNIWNMENYFLDRFIPFLKWILEGFGRTFPEFEYPGSLLLNKSEIDMNQKPESDFNILGYKISKNGMVLFSSIVVLAYCAARIFNLSSSFVADIYKSPFLTITFSVVGLWCIDEFIPKIIQQLFQYCLRVRKNNLAFHVRF